MTQLVGRDQAIEWLVWAGVLSWEDVESVENELDEVILDSIQFGDDDQEVFALSEEEVEDEEDDILDSVQFALVSFDSVAVAVEYAGHELKPLHVDFVDDCMAFTGDVWVDFYDFTD